MVHPMLGPLDPSASAALHCVWLLLPRSHHGPRWLLVLQPFHHISTNREEEIKGTASPSPIRTVPKSCAHKFLLFSLQEEHGCTDWIANRTGKFSLYSWWPRAQLKAGSSITWEEREHRYWWQLESVHGASQVAQLVKNLPASAGDTRDVGSMPGWRRSLEWEVATHPRILA